MIGAAIYKSLMSSTTSTLTPSTSPTINPQNSQGGGTAIDTNVIIGISGGVFLIFAIVFAVALNYSSKKNNRPMPPTRSNNLRPATQSTQQLNASASLDNISLQPAVGPRKLPQLPKQSPLPAKPSPRAPIRAPVQQDPTLVGTASIIDGRGNHFNKATLIVDEEENSNVTQVNMVASYNAVKTNAGGGTGGGFSNLPTRKLTPQTDDHTLIIDGAKTPPTPSFQFQI
jgi:hypothetical protein